MLPFYYIYLILVAAPVMLVVTILVALITIIGTAVGSGSFWGYWPAHVWARLMCFFCFVRVTVKGRENIERKASYVFVANHQGAFDIFSVYGFLGHNFKWMMKKSLGRIFLIGRACKSAGHIFVDNSSPAAVRRTIATAEERLRRGHNSIVVFPEGQRTPTGKLMPFKKGAYQLALEFRLPLVPITISGAYEVMSRHSRLPRPGHITLTIHRPIVAPDTEEGRVKAMADTRDAIASALPARYL